MDSVPQLSIIIPVYNEESRLARTAAELRDFLVGIGIEWEAIIVDDGSRDATVATLRPWLEREPRLRLVRGAGLEGASLFRRGELLSGAGPDPLERPARPLRISGSRSAALLGP